MSSGLGHVGRAILAAFENEPDNTFTTEELCARAYPLTVEPKRAQRVAVLRAVKTVQARRPDLGIKGVRGEFSGRGNPFTFFNCYRVLSYAMARLKSDNLAYRDTPTRWWRSDMLRSEAELRAQLAPGGRHHEYVQPGGAWLRHTEIEIARRDGDHATLERLEAEQERVMGGHAERIQAAAVLSPDKPSPEEGSSAGAPP